MTRKKKIKPMVVLMHTFLIILAFNAIFPFVLLVISSFTAQDEIFLKGYSLFPAQWSLDAYAYLWKQKSQILHAYGITVVITIVGTVANVLITTLLAYPLSRRNLPGGRFLTFIVFFTMLFNGGLVPTYLIYTSVFHIKNTIWALLIPNLLISPWYVLLCKTYFINNIPEELIESGKMDGAGDLRIYISFVLPLAKPIVATVTLFSGIKYWNDWYNGMIYLTKNNLYSLQNLLYRMLSDIQYLSSQAQLGGVVDDLSTKLPSTTVRMAIAVIGVLPIILIYPFIQKNFVKGISIGAVKG